MTYTFDQLLAAYADLGVEPGKTVYVVSDLTGVRDYEEKQGRAILDAHFRALTHILGAGGTLAVSAASMNLCGTETPFDCAKTTSYKVGAFSEFVRKIPETRRSFHPFTSYAVLGPEARNITEGTSRHAYGPQTPEARLIDMDALFVSVGLHPRQSISTVHQVEQVMGVPYRYTKEFIHPVTRDGAIVHEPFYMYVWYRDMDLKRDSNRKLFSRIGTNIDLREVKLGQGSVYSLSMSKFYASAVLEFGKDIYTWCSEPPHIRPYQT